MMERIVQVHPDDYTPISESSHGQVCVCVCARARVYLHIYTDSLLRRPIGKIFPLPIREPEYLDNRGL